MKKSIQLCVFILMGLFCFSQHVDNISIPANFTITKIADKIGSARHIAIANNGDVFIKLENIKENKGIVQLKYNKESYVPEYFGNYSGTGIYIKDNFLFASSNEAIYRYNLDANGNVINKDNPDLIVKDLIHKGQHASKSFVIDDNHNIYVGIGAYSNSCQEKDRNKLSPGQMPCPILEHAGGIWQFSSELKNQSYHNGQRYATGLRHVVGLDWNSQTKSLFVMQHGRDQLSDNFPNLYTTQQNADLPAECLFELTKGSNAGWPYSYYDPFQNSKILAPEYGGDGKKIYTGEALEPTVAFPAHLAPNGLLFYTGKLFPEYYRNGAFIAFHGSWNRAPLPQEGYYVVFVPFKNGKPVDKKKWEIFANGFAGTNKIISPRSAKHRPCGLAQDQAGNLYVTDDSNGAVFKISYNK